jgi:hypothetical protein
VRLLATRCLRILSLFSQYCCFLLGHLLIAAALGPEPVSLTCGLHSSTQHSVRRCANQTMLMDMVHCYICTFMATGPIASTQC